MANKTIIEKLGSARLTNWLIKAAVIYCLILTALWITGLIPPAPYMFWVPLLLWALASTVNLTISLLTRKYHFTGNQIFHIALVVVFAGVLISAFTRFSGTTLLMEGQSFFGEEQDYKFYSSYAPFKNTAPDISFKLEKIIPEYWENRLYFTGLAGSISYPAETLEERVVIHLNGGLKVNRARVRIKSFSLLPELILRKDKEIIARGPVGMLVFPPGAKDTLKIGDYKIDAALLPDTKIIDGEIKLSGMRIDKPAMPIKIEKDDEEIYSGILEKGKTVKFGDYSLRFVGVKRVLEIGVVKDPGEVVIFAGFIIIIAGLIARLFAGFAGKDTNGSHHR